MNLLKDISELFKKLSEYNIIEGRTDNKIDLTKLELSFSHLLNHTFTDIYSWSRSTEGYWSKLSDTERETLLKSANILGNLKEISIISEWNELPIDIRVNYRLEEEIRHNKDLSYFHYSMDKLDENKTRIYLSESGKGFIELKYEITDKKNKNTYNISIFKDGKVIISEPNLPLKTKEFASVQDIVDHLGDFLWSKIESKGIISDSDISHLPLYWNFFRKDLSLKDKFFILAILFPKKFEEYEVKKTWEELNDIYKIKDRLELIKALLSNVGFKYENVEEKRLSPQDIRWVYWWDNETNTNKEKFLKIFSHLFLVSESANITRSLNPSELKFISFLKYKEIIDLEKKKDLPKFIITKNFSDPFDLKIILFNVEKKRKNAPSVYKLSYFDIFKELSWVKEFEKYKYDLIISTSAPPHYDIGFFGDAPSEIMFGLQTSREYKHLRIKLSEEEKKELDRFRNNIQTYNEYNPTIKVYMFYNEAINTLRERLDQLGKYHLETLYKEMVVPQKVSLFEVSSGQKDPKKVIDLEKIKKEMDLLSTEYLKTGIIIESEETNLKEYTIFDDANNKKYYVEILEDGEIKIGTTKSGWDVRIEVFYGELTLIDFLKKWIDELIGKNVEESKEFFSINEALNFGFYWNQFTLQERKYYCDSIIDIKLNQKRRWEKHPASVQEKVIEEMKVFKKYFPNLYVKIDENGNIDFDWHLSEWFDSISENKKEWFFTNILGYKKISVEKHLTPAWEELPKSVQTKIMKGLRDIKEPLIRKNVFIKKITMDYLELMWSNLTEEERLEFLQYLGLAHKNYGIVKKQLLWELEDPTQEWIYIKELFSLKTYFSSRSPNDKKIILERFEQRHIEENKEETLPNQILSALNILDGLTKKIPFKVTQSDKTKLSVHSIDIDIKSFWNSLSKKRREEFLNLMKDRIDFINQQWKWNITIKDNLASWDKIDNGLKTIVTYALKNLKFFLERDLWEIPLGIWQLFDAEKLKTDLTTMADFEKQRVREMLWDYFLTPSERKQLLIELNLQGKKEQFSSNIIDLDHQSILDHDDLELWVVKETLFKSPLIFEKYFIIAQEINNLEEHWKPFSDTEKDKFLLSIGFPDIRKKKGKENTIWTTYYEKLLQLRIILNSNDKEELYPLFREFIFKPLQPIESKPTKPIKEQPKTEFSLD